MWAPWAAGGGYRKSVRAGANTSMTDPASPCSNVTPTIIYSESWPLV